MRDHIPPRNIRATTRSLSAGQRAQATIQGPYQWGEAPRGVRPRAQSASRSTSSTPIAPTHSGPQSHLPAPEEGHPTSGHSASTLSIDGRMPVTGPIGQQAECRHSSHPQSGEVHQAPLPLGGQGGASSHSLAGPSCTAAVPNVAHSAYNPSGGSLRDVGGLRRCATTGSGRTAQPSQPGGGLMQEGGDQPLPTAGGSAPSPPPWSDPSGWNVQGSASSRIEGGLGNHTTFRDASAAVPAGGGPKGPVPDSDVLWDGTPIPDSDVLWDGTFTTNPAAGECVNGQAGPARGYAAAMPSPPQQLELLGQLPMLPGAAPTAAEARVGPAYRGDNPMEGPPEIQELQPAGILAGVPPSNSLTAVDAEHPAVNRTLLAEAIAAGVSATVPIIGGAVASGSSSDRQELQPGGVLAGEPPINSITALDVNRFAVSCNQLATTLADMPVDFDVQSELQPSLQASGLTALRFPFASMPSQLPRREVFRANPNSPGGSRTPVHLVPLVRPGAGSPSTPTFGSVTPSAARGAQGHLDLGGDEELFLTPRGNFTPTPMKGPAATPSAAGGYQQHVRSQPMQ